MHFMPADILLPKTEFMEKWPVIACDQFTSQPDYWDRVRTLVGDAPSTLHLILPEAELGLCDPQKRAETIDAAMHSYLAAGIFDVFENSYVYVERTLMNGSVRKGLVGAIDLNEYDYAPGSTSPIRASERTVLERIPPRKRIRQNAPLELPHVLLLADDDKRALIEPLAAQKASLPPLYALDLMEGGGHLAGWRVGGGAAKAFEERLSAYAANVPEKYADLSGAPVLFAVGDGNHSLATAKACYEEAKSAGDPDAALMRYALVELENIHDEAQKFEPIHRLVKTAQPLALLDAMQKAIGAESGFPVAWQCGEKSGVLCLDRRQGELPVDMLQTFLDRYAKTHPYELDYIHGEDALKTLAGEDGAIGFLLPAIDKGGLFRGIVKSGVLPRKSFSMGHAQEKRYYMEARRIRGCAAFTSEQLC